MTTRVRIGVLAAGLIVTAVLAARVDIPRLTGKHSGDEATFVSMALSLAYDGDLKYRQEDYTRWMSLYTEGPHGLFLKKGPQPTDQALDYGKAHTFAFVAAPFVALLGLGGLWYMNGVLLLVSAACTVTFARARSGPVAGTILGLSFWIASIVPAYLVWMTPEILNVALVTCGLFLWLYKEVAPSTAWPGWRSGWTDVAAALLIGIAAFTKPPNAVFIAPMLCLYLWRRQWRTLLVAAALFLVGSAGNFGLTAWTAGDWNYQGGERKSFYFNFPFDGTGYTFESLPYTMATDDAGTDSYLSAKWIREYLPLNLEYFFIGQYAGLFPWFFPGAAMLVVFLWRWRQSAVWQWLLVLACLGGALVLLLLTPTSWSGGGGPLGNRYFMSLYPALLFLVPAGLHWRVAAGTVVAGLLCVGPTLMSPLASARNPSRVADHWPLHLLPVEMTMIDDSPARMSIDRGRIQFWIDSFVFMYYADAHSYSPEPEDGVPGAPTTGFWIAGNRTATIVVRSPTPLTSVHLTVFSRVPNEFGFDMQGRSGSLTLEAGQTGRIQLVPGRPLRMAASYAYLWTMTTTDGFVPAETEPGSTDDRNLGVFVKPVFRAEPQAAR